MVEGGCSKLFLNVKGIIKNNKVCPSFINEIH